MFRWRIPTGTTGSACFGRESVCWSNSPGITESAFANRSATCRRNSFVHSQTATSLWPSSMPLAFWMERIVCSNGKQPVLDTQSSPLVCYSWITGISDVANVAFVRKRVPEIQYLLASITDQQRREFGQLVDATVGQIESAQFLPRPGIRFPQNGCVTCVHLGLCLGNQPLVDSKLIRQLGASDLDWLDVLDE